MQEIEVRQLFLIILNTYHGFQFDDTKVKIWLDLLKDVPFDRAQRNLRNYIKNPSNQFPPHPGVLAATVAQLAKGPHVPGVEETRLLLQEYDELFRRHQANTQLPDGIRERVKSLAGPSTS